MDHAEYTLVITRRVPNKDYDQESRNWQELNRYNSFPHADAPVRFHEQQVLNVTVGAETFNAIRRAALETL